MAENQLDILDNCKKAGRPESAEERNARLQAVRNKLNEERQRKLEELRAQALAAQRYREQQEEDRRRRLDELRQKEDSRRQQAEQRRKMIDEAEKERRMYIVQKNKDREARLEGKRRNERGAGVFAFGSSTPRLLEPVPAPAVTFWGPRRSLSTHNVSQMPQSAVDSAVTFRRTPEREGDAGGSKKRAASAECSVRASTSMYEVFHWGERPASEAVLASSFYLGRRKTDLMPTVPLRKQQHQPPGSSASLMTSSVTSIRSGPGRAYSMSRLDQLAQPRRGRVQSPPEQQQQQQLPMPPPQRTKSTTQLVTPPGSRPESAMSGSSSVVLRARSAGAGRRNLRPVSIAVTGVSSAPVPQPRSRGARPPASSGTSASTPATPSTPPQHAIGEEKRKVPDKPTPLKRKDEPKPKQEQARGGASADVVASGVEQSARLKEEQQLIKKEETPAPAPSAANNVGQLIDFDTVTKTTPEAEAEAESEEQRRVRITTEEQAKAALAERRRLAREEAERLAEEQARLEQERLQREEEERIREEQLLEVQKRQEQERLAQAIQEAEAREREEQRRRELENQQRLEREEAARREKEEAERQRILTQQRLEQEEKEREERRRRVEAIMSRTRVRQQQQQQDQQQSNQPTQHQDQNQQGQTQEQQNNNNDVDKSEGNSENSTDNSKVTIELYEKSVMEKEATLMNGALENTKLLEQNGHSNGADDVKYAQMNASADIGKEELIQNNSVSNQNIPITSDLLL